MPLIDKMQHRIIAPHWVVSGEKARVVCIMELSQSKHSNAPLSKAAAADSGTRVPVQLKNVVTFTPIPTSIQSEPNYSSAHQIEVLETRWWICVADNPIASEFWWPWFKINLRASVCCEGTCVCGAAYA